MQNVPREHSTRLSTFIKLPFVFKTFVLSIFDLLLKTGFTVVHFQTRVTTNVSQWKFYFFTGLSYTV